MKLSDWREQSGRLLVANWSPALPMDRWIIVGLLGLAFAARAIALGVESLWFDEAYTVVFARDAVTSQTLVLPGGTYLAALHAWLGLGSTEFAIRMLSVLFGVATVGVVFLVARRLFGWRPALWAAGLMAVSPFQVWYSREVRMYSLAALLAWLAVWALLEALSVRGRWVWVGYAAAATLALYTHSFTAFLILAVNLWAILTFILEKPGRGKALPWVASNLAVAGLAVPLLIAVRQQESMGWWGWIADKYGAPGLSDLMRLPISFALGTVQSPWAWLSWLALVAWAATFLWGLVPSLANGESSWWATSGRSWTLAVLLTGVPVLALFLASQFLPMFVVRYTSPFMPAFALLAGRGFARIRRGPVRWGFAAPYLAGVAMILFVIYFVPQKEDWRGAMEYLSAKAPAQAVVFLVDEDILVPVEYYYAKPADFHPIWRGHVSDADLSPRVDTAVEGASEFWLVVSHTDNDAVEEYLLRSADMIERRDFTGVSVLHFHRNGGAG